VTGSLAHSWLAAAATGRTIVVKLGGSVGQEDTVPEDLKLLRALGARVVLVHGGGPLITGWLDRIGKQTHFVHGLRYTDEETLEVVRMVLSGLVNGGIVARLGQAGVPAIGLSGADDSLLVAMVRDAEAGLVGEITATNPVPIEALLQAGYVVVVSPVAVDGEAGFLNVNADTAAAEIAIGLEADRLVFLTDVEGIKGADGVVARSLEPDQARAWIAEGAISGGMIPKVEASIRGAGGSRVAQIVDGRRPHVLLEALAVPEAVGTTVASSATSRR
jgi:acetylglutamate kinase